MTNAAALPLDVALTRPYDTTYQRDLSRLARQAALALGIANLPVYMGQDRNPILEALEEAFQLGRVSGAFAREAAERLHEEALYPPISPPPLTRTDPPVLQPG